MSELSDLLGQNLLKFLQGGEVPQSQTVTLPKSYFPCLLLLDGFDEALTHRAEPMC